MSFVKNHENASLDNWKCGIYEHGFKRIIDLLIALIALIGLFPLLVLLSVFGMVLMRGNPWFFQWRPGKKDVNGQEQIFRIIKLRTMTNDRDISGNLLPDSQRITSYGRFIRSTSLDEIFQLINVVKGDMALIGPRPQLVRDMVFMTEKQRKRHNVRPGISGLAQIRGRNALSWEGKLAADIEYVENISFRGDVHIIFETIGKVLKRENISSEGMDTAEDYGDYLLRIGRITRMMYDEKQQEANALIKAAEFHVV